MGIRPRRVVFAVFVIMGALSGLAALLNALRFADVDPNAGLGLELQVIAAVVVGGVAVTGGRGNLVGTLLGVALLGSIAPALVFLGTNPHLAFLGGKPQWEKAIQGLIILVAVASDSLNRGGTLRWRRRTSRMNDCSCTFGRAWARACPGDSGGACHPGAGRFRVHRHQLPVGRECFRGPAAERRNWSFGPGADAGDHERRHRSFGWLTHGAVGGRLRQAVARRRAADCRGGLPDAHPGLWGAA